jgi:hypothetical protein
LVYPHGLDHPSLGLSRCRPLETSDCEYIVVGTAWIDCAAAQPKRASRAARASQRR